MNDPSQPWPKDRKEVIAGTLEVKNVTDQVNGACRDINFDPTLVPPELSYQMIPYSQHERRSIHSLTMLDYVKLDLAKQPMLWANRRAEQCKTNLTIMLHVILI